MRNTANNYYTTREAAALLGLAVSTIQLWTNKGLLKAWTTAGGHRRILKNSVDELLQKKHKVNSDFSPAEKLSIVVVEDNAQQLRLYEKQIESLGMDLNLEIASDGYKGMIKIGHMNPDIIITDLIMPHMNGFELVKVLNELPELEESLIIVVSGMTADEINTKGGLPERVHQFVKPIPFDEIACLVQQKHESKVA